ncbi:hypothetical protein HELRODRAFT_67530 [Helobdella robusta]|uniref:Protein kinase domain-containing protein n=1 Tax=Helobdella robusta TaxID=6412 RepID=T1FZ23_HELRO|nr:hypothetical protein HELRODRAFT_67530 [Helobdella robusta]ESN96127.1 hypothetical protein HELRODRAFT_67530 [Helobdella robusta]
MGCLKSKPATDYPNKTLSIVETVYQDKNIDKIELNKLGDVKKLNHVNNTNPKLNAYNKLPPIGLQQTYKAKFDPKVTTKYDIKALIGKGCHSRVVRVENKASKQPYAIKVIDRVKAGDMCESELNVLRRVRHPNIIRLVEVIESVKKLYLVVELATGGELFERIITKVYFTETDAVKTLKMILNGASYLHSLGIAHRDLKPENILYYHPGADSKLLITDFGLSGFGVMSTTCGTPEYIAPEVLARQPYTCQVDVWAIGVITFILLSGTVPFEDDNRSRLYRSILKAKYYYDTDHWKDTSQSARDFIDSLLVVDPSKRLTSAMALKHPWITNPPSTGSSSMTNSSKDMSGSGHPPVSTTASAASTGVNSNEQSSSVRCSEKGRCVFVCLVLDWSGPN